MVTGSEKQMKWYEEILKEAYDYLDARYNHKGAHVIHEDTINGTLAVLRQCVTKECCDAKI